jgi:hypothetical protein
MITFIRLSKQDYGKTIMDEMARRRPEKARIELDDIMVRAVRRWTMRRSASSWPESNRSSSGSSFVYIE